MAGSSSKATSSRDNTNEDTEWNDALRKFGIIPEKKEKEITEEEIVQLVESTVEEKMSSDCVCRKKRIEEMKLAAMKARFGEVVEISGEDYVSQVNKAGEGIWVVLHLYKPGIPACKVINYHLQQLAQKFPTTKFLRSVSTVCIPNFPDAHLPAIFVYCNGELRIQMVGPSHFQETLKLPELEWIIAQTGAIKTDLEEDPRPKILDHMEASLSRRIRRNSDSDDDDNDW
ncbi:PDCL3 [Cordylochernes scorpioides]|uniref:PDCL3 n=1 Tax=Cordylochernes scorpioides TaxID=51811 RepID=A0ABY6K958_9ARAC|nr:PDCL3 [Cordylochernes scorpioides]